MTMVVVVVDDDADVGAADGMLPFPTVVVVVEEDDDVDDDVDVSEDDWNVLLAKDPPGVFVASSAMTLCASWKACPIIASTFWDDSSVLPSTWTDIKTKLPYWKKYAYRSTFG